MFTDRPAREVLVEGSIAVVGGGLAGLVAAFELATRGANVVLFESSDRLGGKAGADKDPVAYTGSLAPRTGQLPGGVESDHGYHIFPKWYVNMRALWHRVGIDAHADVVEGGDFLEIPPAVGGQRAEFRPEASIARADLLAMAELITEPDDVVNGLTLQAYLTSRDYIEYKRDSALNNLVLNALTVGDADLSARAIRNVFRQWLPVFHHKNWDMMRGSLDEKLIQPIAKAFVAAGGHICLGHSLTGLSFDGQRMEIEISDRNYASLRWNGTTILAVPFEVLARFDSSVLYESGVPFSRLHKLRANQFAALDVFFTRRLPGITREHFSLAGSRYGLTAVDVGQHWPALMERDRTVLQFVIGRSVEFKQIEDLAFLRAMRDEIGRYLPEVLDPAAVEAFVPHRNAETPLYVNEVGQWEFRLPTHVPNIQNVWFAGDHVQNETDVASMEGAVRSGLVAAEEVRRRVAPRTPDVQIVDPVAFPMLRLLEGTGDAILGTLMGWMGDRR